MLPKVTHNYQTQSSQDMATYQTRTNIFKYSFFPDLNMEWNKLGSNTQNSSSIKSTIALALPPLP